MKYQYNEPYRFNKSPLYRWLWRIIAVIDLIALYFLLFHYAAIIGGNK